MFLEIISLLSISFFFQGCKRGIPQGSNIKDFHEFIVKKDSGVKKISEIIKNGKTTINKSESEQDLEKRILAILEEEEHNDHDGHQYDEDSEDEEEEEK